MQQSSNRDISLIFAENEVFGRSSLQLTALQFNCVAEKGFFMIKSTLVKYVPGRGYFGAVPSQNGSKLDTSPPPSIVERVPQFNGVAERGIFMIKSTGKVALIQAKCMFSVGIPLSDSLWAAQAYWVCNTLNFTATKANSMWYGRISPSPFPFLKPGFVKRKRTNKLEP